MYQLAGDFIVEPEDLIEQDGADGNPGSTPFVYLHIGLIPSQAEGEGRGGVHGAIGEQFDPFHSEQVERQAGLEMLEFQRECVVELASVHFDLGLRRVIVVRIRDAVEEWREGVKFELSFIYRRGTPRY